jgi:hypothetical protein
LHAAGAPFGLFDLQVYAGIILDAYDPQERADSLSGRPLPPYYLPHIHRVDAEREQDSHLVYLAVDFDVIRVVDEGLYQKFQKFLVVFFVGHELLTKSFETIDLSD